MTIDEMHIGIDLGIQQLNSNINRSIFKEEKDYILNKVIIDFVYSIFTNEETSVSKYISYGDIKRYTNALQKHIHSISLPVTNKGTYVECDLPKGNSTKELDNEGFLIDGVSYKIIDKGSINLSNFGYEINAGITNGDIFDCNISNIISIIGNLELKIGTYKIINAGSYDFVGNSSLLVKSNEPNTVFKVFENETLTFTDTNTILKPLRLSPIWESAKLKPINDLKYYLLNSSSSIVTKKTISYGNLTLNNIYRVEQLGDIPIDLSMVGGIKVPTIGYIFTCTSNSSISGIDWESGSNGVSEVELDWGNGNALSHIVPAVNRLVLIKDVDSYLQNTYGNIKSSPISTILNNKLRAYTNNKFKIHYIDLVYVIKPISVSKELGIDCDLPEYLHSFIVDIAVKQLASIMGLTVNTTPSNQVSNQPNQPQ